MEDKDLVNRFTYHAPKEGQPEKYEFLRSGALTLSRAINEMCPEGREKSLAITHLEETIFWANAGIARHG